MTEQEQKQLIEHIIELMRELRANLVDERNIIEFHLMQVDTIASEAVRILEVES
jgi:hypothetical protein